MDVVHAMLFLDIFWFVVCLYGIAISVTRDENLIPYRGQHSISSPDDVFRVGRWTLIVGAIMVVVFTVMWVLVSMAA